MADEVIAIPAGHIASVVTHLEMRERPRLRPMPVTPLRLKRWPDPDPQKYRLLFKRVGAPWLWRGRLILSETALAETIRDPQVVLHAVVDPKGIEVGMVELDFRQPGECEIVYFGLIPDYNGNGHGAWLMAQTLALAWRKDVTRVWLHSCTLDHPGALRFYCKQGFTAYRRELEYFPDPRLEGHYPRDAAPQLPVIE
ncbi:MAG: GNAT family N-acetyltransferase [Blastomonas sp.]